MALPGLRVCVCAGLGASRLGVMARRPICKRKKPVSSIPSTDNLSSDNEVMSAVPSSDDDDGGGNLSIGKMNQREPRHAFL